MHAQNTARMITIIIYMIEMPISVSQQAIAAARSVPTGHDQQLAVGGLHMQGPATHPPESAPRDMLRYGYPPHS